MSDIKRLISLSRSEASKIRNRQLNGTMGEYYDDEDYLCYSEQELRDWKPKKIGRKPKTKKGVWFMRLINYIIRYEKKIQIKRDSELKRIDRENSFKEKENETTK